MSRANQQQPTKDRAVLSVWVAGQVWSYKEGSTRIFSYDGQEINVWDHATARPGVEFTRAAIEQRVREWVEDEQEADSPPPAPATGHAGTVRVADGHGCTERVPAWELDPYGYEGNQ